jgi:hypothetical protein
MINHITTVYQPPPINQFTIVVSSEHVEKFKELIQRGANLWPDAPYYIKEFADVITNGKPLQNYRDHSADQLKT